MRTAKPGIIATLAFFLYGLTSYARPFENSPINNLKDVSAVPLAQYVGKLTWECTGVLVSPSVVLTNAHCLPSNGDNINKTDQVYFDQAIKLPALLEGSIRRKVISHYRHPKFNVDDENTRKYDYGIIFLADDGAPNQVPALSVAQLGGASATLSVIGYPSFSIGGFPYKYGVLTYSNCDPSSLRISRSNVVEHSCSTMPGSSGSLMLLDGRFIGIHSGTKGRAYTFLGKIIDNTVNVGILFDSEMIQTIQTWLNDGPAY